MNTFLKKDDVKILYGVAILLMLFHHLFCIPERLNSNYISFLIIDGKNIEVCLAWFAKICVAIYAFISGYGLFIKFDNPRYDNLNIIELVSLQYKKIIIKIWSFLKLYWLVFSIFIPVGFIFFNYKFDTIDFILNFFGLRTTYNLEWWYARQYFFMLVCFPIINLYFKVLCNENNYIYRVILIILGLYFFFIFRNNYLAVFIVGYIFAKFKTFEKLDRLFIINNSIESVSYYFLFSIMFLTRLYFADNPGYMKLDFVLTPILIYSLIKIIKNEYIKNILVNLGKVSLFMWLSHSFYCYYFFQSIILIPRISILIYIWLIIISFITALLLNKLNIFICNNFKINNKILCVFNNMPKKVE